MTTTRPHRNVPQTGIIYMISHTPPRCGAKRTDAQRQERERIYKSGTFPVSRVTISAVPARDAASSPWMYPPAVAQRLADVCLLVFKFMWTLHKCTSHSPTTEHHLRTLYHVCETCSCQLTRSKYSWLYHHRPKIHQPAHLRLAVCHLLEVTCVAHRTR